MTATRRLTAILAADVAGYSRLMGADEEGTHERLKAHLGELVEPKISQHRGRTVKNTGDGLLAEFVSVVDAVRCAVEIQRGMAEREPEVPEERRIRFRIGINLGDVIVEEHDIFGDGVNIAARLEGLAAPGGVCVSGTVLDHIGDRLPYAFADMGEQKVKNIARPVRVYALRSEAVRDRPKSAVLDSLPISQPTAAPRLSIVVLPFANLSNDPEQQYFADGITEDLTTDLSRLAGMLVRSRIFNPGHLGLLAEALALAGKIEEALAALDDGLAEAAISGERGWNAEIHRLRGELTARLPHPDPAKAEDSFRTALAIAREQGTRGYELRAATSLARLSREQGRRGEARDLLAPVYGWFTEGFDTQDLKEAKALLEELAA